MISNIFNRSNASDELILELSTIPLNTNLCSPPACAVVLRPYY